MKIAILGANSALGSSLVKKAEEAKISVVNLVSNAINLVGQGRVVIKDYSDLTLKDIADCHYVIDTESFLRIDKYSSDLLPLWHLLEIMRSSRIKLLALGSSSFLYTDKSRSQMVFQSECQLDYVQSLKGRLSVNAYLRLKSCTNVDWSVLCPPLLVEQNGYGCGEIEFSNDILPMGLNGDSSISQNDFVLAVVELLKRGPKSHQCVSVRALRTHI